MSPEDFIVEEAALLDAGRFDEWLALFAQDGHYWVPLLGARQADAISHNSLVYDDRLLLTLRVQRLKNPRAHSQQPRSECQHLLQRPVVEATDARGASVDALVDAKAIEHAGEVRLRTPFIYVESRAGKRVMLTGTCRHHLERCERGWAIRLKRIDLIDPGMPLPAIQLFI